MIGGTVTAGAPITAGPAVVFAPSIWRHVLAALWVVAVIWLTGCFPAAPSRSNKPSVQVSVATLPRPAPQPGGYVGSTVCRECHQDISEKYATHPMAQSASAVEAAPQIETFPHRPIPAPGGFEYLAQLIDGRQTHHEILRAADQSPLFDHSLPMDYLIGSGKRGRSYLSRQGHYLIISALTWYSQRGKWDLSPGYSKHDRHFERRAIEGCLQCHIGRVAAGDGTDQVVDPVFHEAAIGCERCHGPAEEHVNWHRQHATADKTGADPILRLGTLPSAQREAVCYQCHLLGVERVLRYGRREYDFRPGDDLSANWVIFSQESTDVTDDSTAAVNQVPQMQSSRCFQASQGRLGCTSCHDPHDVPDPAHVVEHYRSRCLQCHTTSTTCSVPEETRRARHADDSCIACHMPKLLANDVPHTSQTDHRILRRATDAAESKPNAPSEQLQLLPGMAERVPPLEIDRARGLLMAQYASDTRDVILAAAAEDVLKGVPAAPDDIEYWRAWGDLHALQQRPELAEDAWKRVLQVDPDDEQTLRRLGIHYHDLGQDTAAAEMLQRVLHIHPWDRISAGRMVHVLGRLQRLDEAFDLAEQTSAKYPWDTSLQDWLAHAYQSQGRVAEAERCRAIVNRLRRAR
jgi:predicted CXXCH cytochrome family protein